MSNVQVAAHYGRLVEQIKWSTTYSKRSTYLEIGHSLLEIGYSCWTLDILEKPDDFPIFVNINLFRRGHLWKSGHRHDIAANHHNELGACGQANFPDIDHVARRGSPQFRISGE